MVLADAMSDVKFACPVCGQHITADSESSGRHLECPTCFQKIIVPQPPALPDSKLILSASKVGKPRPATIVRAPVLVSAQPTVGERVVPLVALVLVLAGGAAAAWVFWLKPPVNHAVTAAPRPAQPKQAATVPIPAQIAWSLDTTDLVFPAEPATGAILGHGFKSEKASIQGGVLSFRQGKRWSPELGLSVALPARQADELSGRTLEFATNHPAPLPRITLHWKDQEKQQQKQEFARGYALKVAFGQAAAGRLPGRIYLCLPDAANSVLAGTFEAEIKLPSAPKPAPAGTNQAPWPP